MGLFDFFKSDEEKVRSKIRKGFDGCVRTAVKSAGTNDSFYAWNNGTSSYCRLLQIHEGSPCIMDVM